MQSCAIESRQRLFRCSHREKKSQILSVKLAEIGSENISSVKVRVHLCKDEVWSSYLWNTSSNDGTGVDHGALFTDSQASQDREDDPAGLADQGLEPHQLRYFDPVQVAFNLEPENTNLRELFNAQLTSCWFCLDSAALLVLNEQQFYLFGQIKNSQTLGKPYSATSPFGDFSLAGTDPKTCPLYLGTHNLILSPVCLCILMFFCHN